MVLRELVAIRYGSGRWVAGWWIRGQTVGTVGLQGDGSEDKPSVQMGCRVMDPRTNRRYRWVAWWWIRGQTVGTDGLQGDGSEDKSSVQMGCRVVDPRTKRR